MPPQLGEMDRCRKLYEKYLEWTPENCNAWYANWPEAALDCPCSLCGNDNQQYNVLSDPI